MEEGDGMPALAQRDRLRQRRYARGIGGEDLAFKTKDIIAVYENVAGVVGLGREADHASFGDVDLAVVDLQAQSERRKTVRPDVVEAQGFQAPFPSSEHRPLERGQLGE